MQTITIPKEEYLELKLNYLRIRLQEAKRNIKNKKYSPEDLGFDLSKY